jgi:hypothetical protein
MSEVNDSVGARRHRKRKGVGERQALFAREHEHDAAQAAAHEHGVTFGQDTLARGQIDRCENEHDALAATQLRSPSKQRIEYRRVDLAGNENRAGAREAVGLEQQTGEAPRTRANTIPAQEPPRERPVAALLVKPRAARAMLACSHKRLYELMRDGQLDSFRDGASRKITVASIERYIARGVAGGANLKRSP